MVVESASSDVSRHKCLVYDGKPADQLAVILPLLIGGLRENRRCLYLADPQMVHMTRSALNRGGVDVDKEIRRGALLLSSDRSHLAGGAFDPEGMVAMLRQMVEQAVADGFVGLCASGDMRWELGDFENFDRLREYEALLEQAFRELPLTGICQYHKEMVPPSAIQDALLTHQSLYVGHTLNRNNLFYLPPELLLKRDEDTLDKHGEWMYQQIRRVVDAESKRDEVLDSLRESERRQRELADKLAQANRELERRVEERTAELTVANAELESFSYSVSHDLRAPLRGIDGFSQALAEDFGEQISNEGHDNLGRIRAASKRMAELIDGMLTLAHASRGDLHRTTVDLSEIAEEVAAELRRAEPGRRGEFVIQKGLKMTGDRRLMRAVVENLLGNAWKFTGKRSAAQIEFNMKTGDDGEVVFCVRDNGAGFDMDHAKKLFTAFGRLHREEDYRGTGIGLATVQRIIRRHGGRIWAEGRPGKGAAFFFSVPPTSR